MRATNVIFSVLLSTLCAFAQVLAPQEIRDPKIRELQQKYQAELKLIAQAALLHNYPYHFYFSRILDLAEKDQPGNDQRAIQFDSYKDQVVLKITGNYFAAYSTSLMTPEERARQTYQDVMLPLIQAAAPALLNVAELQAYAFEISHHIRKKILGVSSEGVENVVLILPKASAERLAQASSATVQQAAIAEGEVFLNAAPISLWPHAEVATATGSEAPAAKAADSSARAVSPSVLKGVIFPPGLTKTSVATVVKERPPANPAATVSAATSPSPSGAAISATSPLRDTSPEALKNIQQLYQASVDRMVQELNPQAHFVRYAPPAFIPFHKGLYLQLSVTTMLPEPAAGSRYKLAALAFDQHVAHLIRPALSYFKEDRGDFDGIDFSSSVRLNADPAAEGGSVAVEFIFPLNLLRAYEQFDCTGQELIDASFVLINGERVSLNLLAAEAGFQTR
ncbi:MAG TPA: hypothetical protein VN841_14000 [Bryobacteraceae bacterium]|nr:hypothetical protein [Bryobacteraceae bacterium]